MTTRAKIVTHVRSLPPFACTHRELADRLDVSIAGVRIALTQCLDRGLIRIVGKDGHRCTYEATNPEACHVE